MDFYGFLVAFYGFYRILLILWISGEFLLTLWICMRFCRISMDSILSIYGFLWVSVFLNGLWISSGWAYVVVWVGGLRGLGYCDFLVSWRSGIFVFTASFPKGVSGCWSYIVLVQKHPLAPPAPGKALECSTQM